MTGGSDARDWVVRRATADELGDVLGVLDGANLETDAGACRDAIERGQALVAESDASDSATVLGTLVLEGNEISQIAVRRRRRARGIGTALVAAAAESVDGHGELAARFDPGVRPFYEALGFEIEPATEERRFVGRLDAGDSRAIDDRPSSDAGLDDLSAGGE